MFAPAFLCLGLDVYFPVNTECEEKTMDQELKKENKLRAISEQQLRQIQELAQSVRYGSITLVFQDGILIQIDKNEKIRFSK